MASVDVGFFALRRFWTVTKSDCLGVLSPFKRRAVMPLRQYLCLLILIAKQEVSYVNCPQCVSAFHVRLLLKGGLSKTRGWRVCNITLRMFTNNRSLSIPSLDYAKSISSCEVPRLLRGTGGSGDEYAFKLIVSYLAFWSPTCWQNRQRTLTRVVLGRTMVSLSLCKSTTLILHYLMTYSTWSDHCAFFVRSTLSKYTMSPSQPWKSTLETHLQFTFSELTTSAFDFQPRKIDRSIPRTTHCLAQTYINMTTEIRHKIGTS